MLKQLKSKLSVGRDKDAKDKDVVMETGPAVVAVRPKGFVAEASAADTAAAANEGPGPGPARSHSVLPVGELQGSPGFLRVQTRRPSVDEHTVGSPSTSSFRENFGGSSATTPKSPAGSAFSGSSEMRAEKDADKKDKDSKDKDSKMSRLGSLFKSTSKSGREKAQNGSSNPLDSVEAMGGAGDGTSSANGWLDNFEASKGVGKVQVPQRSVKSTVVTDGFGRNSSMSSGTPDGAYRSGSLMATPVSPGMRRVVMPVSDD